MGKRIIYIIVLLSAILYVNLYNHLQQENTTQLVIGIFEVKDRIDCVELYANNVYHKSYRTCILNESQYHFKDLPKTIKNLRIDFGSKSDVSFKINYIKIGTKNNLNEITSLKNWGSDQISVLNGEYKTTGNDSKIFGDVGYINKNTIWDSVYILYIPLILIFLIGIYLIYISEKNLILDYIAISGFFLGFISAFPGHTNFDELYTLGEYFRGEVSDMHPPMQMLLTAKFIELGKLIRITPLYSISLILMTQLILYWWSLREISKLIRIYYIRILFLLVLCLAPIALVYASHIGKDSQMAVALILSFALISKSSRKKNFIYLLLAIPPIFYAFTIRANAPAAVLPLIVYWSLIFIKNKPPSMRSINSVFIPCIALIILIYSASNFINKEVIKYKCCGGIQLIMTPVYDLMGVSKQIKENLVPSILYINKYTLEDINTNFDSTYINWNGLKQANYDLLVPVLREWYLMIKKYPYEFIQHRINTLKYFFGLQSKPVFPYMSGFYNNIEKTGKSSTTLELVNSYNDIKKYLYFNNYFDRYFSRTADSMYYRLWVYLLFNLIIYFLMIKYRVKISLYAKVLTYSSILYILPYLILANSAQFRYVYWSALALYILFFINLDKLISKIYNNKLKQFSAP